MSVVGRWRIVETELWDSDALNLVAPVFIEFGEDGMGSFGFIAVQGELDCQEVTRDGRPGVEFSWEGNDDCDPASGRGWAVLEEGESLRGRIFFHLGDDSSFTAVRAGEPTQERCEARHWVKAAMTEISGGSADPVERETAIYPGRFIGEDRLVQYAGRILRPYPDKATAEIHDHHDLCTEFSPHPWPNAPGCPSLGFPDPRRSPYTPSSGKTGEISQSAH